MKYLRAVIMAADIHAYRQLIEELAPYRARLVAVSKTKPVEDIRSLYEAGQRDFGENYVQELVEKQGQLPADVAWHFIGHLQTNKVKYIAPFVTMIHGVDHLRLLREIAKQGSKCGRMIDCLLQVHIAREETKYGLDEQELVQLLEEVIVHPESYQHVRLCGLMGMATNTRDQDQIRREFRDLKALFDKVRQQYVAHPQFFTQLSMGMSGDYAIALEEGSNMVRIGSLLFGARQA